PVAITGRSRSFSARATLTPFPPATVLDSTARWRRPRRRFGTATVRSIAAFKVTVRITGACLPPRRRTFETTLEHPSPRAAPGQRRRNQYHDRDQPGPDDPDDDARTGDRVVHVRHHGVARGGLHAAGCHHRYPADGLPGQSGGSEPQPLTATDRRLDRLGGTKSDVD